MGDPLGSNSIALNNLGQVIALQHYSPYGTVDYSWGTMPTSFNYAGERLDGQTGLLYDNFRYYDPVTGRFVRSDTVQDNSKGDNPYAYVGDNPETRNDPTGHCWPICAITALVGGVAGAVVGVVAEASQHGTDFGSYNWGHVAVDAGVGAVAGFMIGTGVGAAVGIGMITGGVTSGIGAVANHKSWGDVVQSTFEGAAIGGIMSGLTAGMGEGFGLASRSLGQLTTGQGVVRALAQGGIQALGGMTGNMLTQTWDSWRTGDPSLNFGQVVESGAISFGAGFVGQWAYDHWPVFQTGESYPNRGARQAQRDANWDAQSNWGNGISGASQGIIQVIQATSGNNGTQSSEYGPRIGGGF